MVIKEKKREGCAKLMRTGKRISEQVRWLGSAIFKAGSIAGEGDADRWTRHKVRTQVKKSRQ